MAYIHELVVNTLGVKIILVGVRPAVVKLNQALFGFQLIGEAEGRSCRSVGKALETFPELRSTLYKLLEDNLPKQSA